VQDLGSWRADSSQADEALRKLDAAGINKARGAAQAALDALMLTDAPLLYSPSLVALAALRAGFRKVLVLLLFLAVRQNLHAFCFPCEQQQSTCTNGKPCGVCRLKYHQASTLHMLPQSSKR